MKAIPTPARPAAKPVQAAATEPTATEPTTIDQFSRTLPVTDVMNAAVFAVRVADWVSAADTTADLDRIKAEESELITTILKSKSVGKDHPGRKVLQGAKPKVDTTIGTETTIEVFLAGEHKFDRGDCNKSTLIRVKSKMGGKAIQEMRSPLNWVKLLACIEAGGSRLRETIDRTME